VCHATYINILVAVIRQGFTLVCIGLLFGTVAALIGARFVETSSDYFSRQILFGVTGNDASTLSSTVLVLAVSASIACWIPARRAARIDPIAALRQ
jgi:putative ABC transport system permease protein